jgi:hypothetical protein
MYFLNYTQLHAGGSLAAGVASRAGEVLNELADKEIPLPSWLGLDVGLHPHLVKTQLSRNCDNGEAMPRKQAEAL